jgi:hypothetical protein
MVNKAFIVLGTTGVLIAVFMLGAVTGVYWHAQKRLVVDPLLSSRPAYGSGGGWLMYASGDNVSVMDTSSGHCWTTNVNSAFRRWTDLGTPQ